MGAMPSSASACPESSNTPQRQDEIEREETQQEARRESRRLQQIGDGLVHRWVE